MKDYKKEFVKFCIDNQVLLFGNYKLKSGRSSPYFFNAGLFHTGKSLQQLGKFYASAIYDYASDFDDFPFDVLFGPAYKGIPLVSSTAIALQTEHQLDVPFAFNRKEAKDHGEGGMIVGASLEGNIVIVDDVITAGTAVRESLKLINTFPNTKLAGVLIALDRQEKAPDSSLTATECIRDEFNVPVISIIKLEDIIDYLELEGNSAEQVRLLKDHLEAHKK